MLAEYIDGGLEPRERAEVEQHLAECGECYENFADALRATATLPVAAETPRPATNLRKWYAIAASVLTLGVLAQFMWNRTSPAGSALTEMIASMPESRVTDARLSVEHDWRPAASATRGANRRALPAEAVVAIGSIDRMLVQRRDVKSMQAAAVARLAQGRPAEAVALLREVASQSPSADAWSDLGAALISLGTADGDTSNFEEALAMFSRALSIDPAHAPAQFNRAVAFEKLHRSTEAITAWKAAISGKSPDGWAAEARSRLAILESGR